MNLKERKITDIETTPGVAIIRGGKQIILLVEKGEGAD